MAFKALMKEDVITGFDGDTNGFHEIMAGGRAVTGDELINVF